MIRTRRLYAYSEKLYSYYLLIVLFAGGVYSFNLFLRTTELFRSFTTTLVTLLSSAGIMYGGYLLTLLILILFKDRMLLAWKIMKTLLHMIICSFMLVLVQILSSLSAHGMTIEII